MASVSNMRTPLSRVRHLGSAREGAMHFWRQRVTGAAMIPLSFAMIVLIVSMIGQSYEGAVALLSAPWATVVLVLFFITVAIHMRLGVQVVIEDYIHGHGLKVVLLVASTFFSFLVAAIGIVAALKLAFGA